MNGTCLSDLAIDRITAGGPEAAHVAAHVAGCPACSARLAVAMAAKESFAARPLPWAAAGSVVPMAPRQQKGPRRTRGWVTPVAALAATVALAVGMTVGGIGRDGVRSKGGVGHLSFDVLRPGATAASAWDGDALHAGDVLQWIVRLQAPRWVVIVGRDGAGVVSAYYPEGARAVRVESGEAVPLDRSLTLDGTVGDEALAVFFCEREVAVDEAVAATRAASAGAPTLDGCEVQRLTLPKAAP